MRIFTKETNYRCERLLDIARHAPKCMSCGAYNQGDVVAAHSNALKHGKGKGIKAHDLVAYVCRECHSQIDGAEGGLSREAKYLMFMDAFYNTVLWLLREGHLKVVSK